MTLNKKENLESKAELPIPQILSSLSLRSNHILGLYLSNVIIRKYLYQFFLNVMLLNVLDIFIVFSHQ